jgi:hypothetical protein
MGGGGNGGKSAIIKPITITKNGTYDKGYLMPEVGKKYTIKYDITMDFLAKYDSFFDGDGILAIAKAGGNLTVDAYSYYDDRGIKGYELEIYEWCENN